MTESNNPLPPPPPPQGEDLQTELARSRSRNKALKVTLLLLLTLFALLGVVAFTVYRKIMQTKEAVEEAFQGLPQTPLFRAENTSLPAGGPSVFSSTGMPASSLGLFSGGVPGAQPEMDKAQAERIMKAMNKYAERPLVKEFIADLKTNPDMAKAFDLSKGNNPIAVVSTIRNARGVDKIVAKYATRPEFLKLMMEIMNDPDMQAVTGSLPNGLRPNAGQQVQVRPIPGPDTEAEGGAGDQDGDGEMTLDPSAISGQPAPPAPHPAKKVPSPVDTGL